MNNKYQIIYADPPWKFNNKNTGGSMSSGSVNKYSVLSSLELKEIDIPSIANENCFLFMWWVASMPEEAIQLVKDWGFQLKTMTAFSWIKKTKNWKDYFGMGFYTRQQQEHCLLAIKGHPKVVSHSIRQNIRAKNIQHSSKPNEVRNKIVELCGSCHSSAEFMMVDIIRETGLKIAMIATPADSAQEVAELNNLPILL